MDLCNTKVSDTHTLSEQIAREVFDVLPERGPILVIMDREGNVLVQPSRGVRRAGHRARRCSRICGPRSMTGPSR